MLANIEHRSNSTIWQSQSAIYKGTLLAGVFLEQLIQKCKSETVYLLRYQAEKLDEKDLQIEQAGWEKKLTKVMTEQLNGKNSLETSYA